MRVVVAALLGCTACGRIAFEPLPGTAIDASGDSATGAVDAATACATWGPFSTPVHVSELASTAPEFSTGLSADGLVIVFDSQRAPNLGGYDLWQATRTSTTAPFGTPTPLTSISSSNHDDSPALSQDGNTIYFNSDRGTGSIWAATRASRTVPFDAPVALTGPVMGSGACCPSLSPDQLTMYLAIFSANWDVYVSTRATLIDDFTAPVELTVLSSAQADWVPSISSDGLELFFQSNRPDATDYDIYVSRRATTTDPWGAPQLVPNVSTPTYAESDPEISPDGRTLWFAIEDHPAGMGGGDIYYATRDCL